MNKLIKVIIKNIELIVKNIVIKIFDSSFFLVSFFNVYNITYKNIEQNKIINSRKITKTLSILDSKTLKITKIKVEIA